MHARARSASITSNTLAALAVLALCPVAIAAPDHDAIERLEAMLPPVQEPELGIGDTAPALTIAEYVKGDPIGAFEPGTAYVVEFWATWCAPCIAAFPHLSELSAEHGDAVEIVGVNIWEQTSGDERLDQVRAFVEDQGERMSYTVAIEQGESMAANWMRPAGQNGIPAAFIVDGDGKIAWVGHPMGLDEPLEMVTSDGYDLGEVKAGAMRERLMMSGLRAGFTGYQAAETIDAAREITDLLVSEFLEEHPRYLASVAMFILENESGLMTIEDKRLALRAGAKACAQSDWDDWVALHAYAMGLAATGDRAGALKWQERAVEMVNEDPEASAKAIDELEAALTEYKGEG